MGESLVKSPTHPVLSYPRSSRITPILSLFLCLLLSIWSAPSTAAPPTITSFWPPTGTPDATIFVFGNNFDLTPGATQVQVNSLNAPIAQIFAGDFLAFLLPAGNTNGTICLTTSQGSACSARPFGSTPLPGTAITSIWPSQGRAGSFVFIFGAGFDPAPGKTRVSLGSTPAPFSHVVDTSLIVFSVPAGAASGPVWVTTPLGLAVSPVSFTTPAIIPPSPTPLDPSKITLSAIVNGQVTLYGGVGSVSLGDTVIVTNTRTGAQASVAPNPDGSFSATLVAQIGDNFSLTTRNATGSSPTIQVAVMYLTITAPTAGATLSSDRVLVSGTMQAPSNTGVTVNGVAAERVGTQFLATISLATGSGSITVQATDQNGFVTSRSVPVTVVPSTSANIEVNVTPLSGSAPLVVRFSATERSGQSLRKLEVDADGNGARDYLSVFFDTPVEHTYASPGVYSAKVTVTDNNGTAHVSTHTIVVRALNDVDTLLRGIYTGMLQQLKTGNIDGALTAVTGSMQSKYRAVFTTLKPSLATIVDQLGTIQTGSIGDGFAEYVLVRTENGKSVAYLIYFIRGEDGVWRVDGM